MKINKTVYVGISGGVDSATAAYLLLKKGYNVVGVTHVLSGEMDQRTVKAAKRTADYLGIRHIVWDFSKNFNEYVKKNFINEYKNGRTPNPCILCNEHIKFGIMLKKAFEENADFIATGHYAKIEYDNKYKCRVLKKANAAKKDQTYFLYRLNNEMMGRILFPLGNLPGKEEVRKIAEKAGLEAAEKKESQEICFIPDNNYASYIKGKGKNKVLEGSFTDINGNILGRHKGVIHYTVGQRKGLGIPAKKPLYVIDIDIKANKVVLGEENNLYKNKLTAGNMKYLLPKDIIVNTQKFLVKTRHSKVETEAALKICENNKAEIVFKTPVKMITPGQSAVCYINDVVACGGIIENEREDE